MFTKVLDLLRGLVGSPAVHGVIRGAVEAAVFVLLYGIADILVALPDLALFAPMILLGVRTLEGVVDGIDPAKKRSEA